jgi:ascorbate PTS system EIIA or EIIAB component
MNLLREYLLSKKTVAFGVNASDWKEAIRRGTDLLVKTGSIEPRYYDEIVKSTEKLGPYYILAPGIAMPHARPEGGVIENGFSLVTLIEPVAFGDEDNDPIDILLTMAAKDTETQNKEAIVQIVTFFDSEGIVEKLRRAHTPDDLENIFKDIEES